MNETSTYNKCHMQSRQILLLFCSNLLSDCLMGFNHQCCINNCVKSLFNSQYFNSYKHLNTLFHAYFPVCSQHKWHDHVLHCEYWQKQFGESAVVHQIRQNFLLYNTSLYCMVHCRHF